MGVVVGVEFKFVAEMRDVLLNVGIVKRFMRADADDGAFIVNIVLWKVGRSLESLISSKEFTETFCRNS